MNKIPLIKPYITQEIKDKVCEVLDSGYLTEGPITKDFENAVKHFVGCKHAIAVTSCTTGLEMALRVFNIGPGDEVIVPNYTYPATADVVAIVGATIVIVDVSKDTMLIDYDALEQAITPRTKAIIPVSIFGNPLDYDRLNPIKEKHGVYIIEDAACAIGAEYKGIRVGNYADISVFSLHPRKFITTGEGGMITTNHAEWAAWMESYKHFGMDVSATREGTVFARIGTNYKLSNILAAVGLVQMQHIDELLNKRIELAERYKELLSGVDKIQIPQTTAGGKHSYQSFCLFVENRDEIMKHMRKSGIEVQIGTYAIHMHPAFSEGRHVIHHGSFEGSRYALDHCLTIPLYHELTDHDQKCVIDMLQSFL
ncbi:MAG: DegT/DnrJ/EryC1/StrS aminotransferase family protein [Deltaproteobacteria bacterium]|nr:DegT/DnrJ/EryC1/StrS aminotransferase family protein [Deltaproteobacteria bacterium]